MRVRKEAVLSSRIEGTQSSLQNLLAAEAQLADPDTPADVGEVINYVRAMNYGLNRLVELPLSVRLIREIHAELMRGARGGRLTPGELRTTQNWIGPGGCSLREASFVPPPPREVPAALSDLERDLHSGDALPPLVRVGLVHAQFETIHPFLDGKGRVGRLLITFSRTEMNLLARPVLYLSRYFKRRRSEYCGRPPAIRDAGDRESWLEFFLTGVTSQSTRRRRNSARDHRLRAQPPLPFRSVPAGVRRTCRGTLIVRAKLPTERELPASIPDRRARLALFRPSNNSSPAQGR